MPIKLVIEASKSRSGLHAERKIAFIVGEKGEIVEARGSGEPVKPVYSIGEAKMITVNITPKQLAVQVRLVKGLRDRVKGYIAIYDYMGREVYRVVIRKRKLKPSRGDRRYHKIIESIVEKITLAKYLRKYKI
ncbi:MAG: hypothetical protein QXR22_03595 [Acidilobaceae archaeon]